MGRHKETELPNVATSDIKHYFDTNMAFEPTVPSIAFNTVNTKGVVYLVVVTRDAETKEYRLSFSLAAPLRDRPCISIYPVAASAGLVLRDMDDMINNHICLK